MHIVIHIPGDYVTKIKDLYCESITLDLLQATLHTESPDYLLSPICLSSGRVISVEGIGSRPLFSQMQYDFLLVGIWQISWGPRVLRPIENCNSWDFPWPFIEIYPVCPASLRCQQSVYLAVCSDSSADITMAIHSNFTVTWYHTNTMSWDQQSSNTCTWGCANRIQKVSAVYTLAEAMIVNCMSNDSGL